MRLRVEKHKSVKEANQNVEIEEIYPFFSALSDNEQKIIILAYDYNSPFYALPHTQKTERISRYLDCETEQVKAVFDGVKEKGSAIQTGFNSYMQDHVDPLEEMIAAITEQITKVSRDIRSLDIHVGKTASEDKSFDHFQNFTAKSFENITNLINLRSKRPGIEEEVEEDFKPENDPLLRRHQRK